jgi:hypothetical protein
MNQDWILMLFLNKNKAYIASYVSLVSPVMCIKKGAKSVAFIS